MIDLALKYTYSEYAVNTVLRCPPMLSISDRTSQTLIFSLKSRDNDDCWTRFIDTYEPLLASWLRANDIPSFRIPEVLSDVYLKLVENIGTFVYDPSKSFRGWLRVVTENAARDVQKRAWNRYETPMDTVLLDLNRRLTQHRQLDDELLEQFLEELERKVNAANAVADRVRTRVTEKTWRAFYLTEVEGMTCSEAGLELGMPENSVYVARFRIRKSLKVEAAKIGLNAAVTSSDAS